MARIIDLMPGESHTFPDGTIVRAVLPVVLQQPSRIEQKSDVGIAEEVSTIRRIRRRLGMTQQQLANGLGCSQAVITKYENGGSEPSPEMVEKLIAFCASYGLCITFDHVYGDAELPAAEQQEPEKGDA